MGAHHLSAVYANWGGLPDQPFRLLAYMALTVPDAHSDPHFYGGRRMLAFALGRAVADDEELPAATVQAVKRNIQILRRAGAIETVYGGWRNENAKYRLHLLAPQKGDAHRTPSSPVDNGERGTVSDPERGTVSDPNGVQILTERGTPTDPPRSTRRSRSETKEEISSKKVSTEDAVAGINGGMDLVTAKRVIRDFVDNGGVLPDILADAPDGLSKSERDVWAAAVILGKASA